MVPAHVGVAGNLASNASRGQGTPGVRSRKGQDLPPGWRVVLQANGKTKGGQPKFKEAFVDPDGAWVRGGWPAVHKRLVASGELEASVGVAPTPVDTSTPISY